LVRPLTSSRLDSWGGFGKAFDLFKIRQLGKAFDLLKVRQLGSFGKAFDLFKVRQLRET